MKPSTKPFQSLLLLGLVSGLAVLPAAAETVKPFRAEKFRQSIGVNTHINYTDGAYAQVPFVIDAVKYLGIDYVRDHTPTPWIQGAGQLPSYEKVLASGIKFDFGKSGGVETQTMLNFMSDFDKRYPGSIIAMEGPNEVDHAPITYKGLTGTEAAKAHQKDYYQAIKANPQFQNMPVYDFTDLDHYDDPSKAAPGSTPVKTIDGRADFLNFHIYAQNGNPPRQWMQTAQQTMKYYKMPGVITEFGYSSWPQSGWLVIGVDETVQAKGLLNGIFNSFDMGFERIFLYELVDQKADPDGKVHEHHTGLFDYKFRKKKVAVALRAVTQLLKDKAPAALTFNTRPLDLNIKGLPATGHYFVVEKSDGKTYLALWNEAPFWDRATGKPLTETRVPLTVTLGGAAKIVGVTDPLNTKSPTQTYKPTSSLAVTLLDHPILIEITR